MKIKQNNDILDIPLLLRLPDTRANLYPLIYSYHWRQYCYFRYLSFTFTFWTFTRINSLNQKPLQILIFCLAYSFAPPPSSADQCIMLYIRILWWHTSATTCQIIMLTCQIFLLSCQIYMLNYQFFIYEKMYLKNMFMPS